ncbi:MAG: serine protease [Acidimicrobiia bacterium]
MSGAVAATAIALITSVLSVPGVATRATAAPTVAGDQTSAAAPDVSAASAPTLSAPPSNGRYHALTPARIVDTRIGLGGRSGGLGPDETMTMSPLGVAGVPAGQVTAVAVNITATNTTESGFLTSFPDGVARPIASVVNFAPERSSANLAVVSIGANGRIAVYNSAGTTDVVVDVVGWFDDFYDLGVANGGYLAGLAPARVLDTRTGIGAPAAPLGPDGQLDVKLRGVGGVPDRPGVTGVVLNLTATDPTDAGYLTMYPAGSVRPTASNVNFVAGDTVPNLAFATLSPTGTATIYNYAGTTDVLVDVVGYFATDLSDSSGQLFSITPARIADTRNGTGVAPGPIAGGTELVVPIAGRGGLPSGGVSSVVLNVTVTEPSSAGFVTLYPSDGVRPEASNLNFGAGQTIPNLVLAKVGPDGAIKAFNYSGSAHLIVDVVGWYSDAKSIGTVSGASADDLHDSRRPTTAPAQFLRATNKLPGSAADRWTPERLAKAVPVAIGSRGGDTVKTGQLSTALADDLQITHPTYGGGFLARNLVPKSTAGLSPIGRLYLDPTGSGQFTGACSAAVIDTDVIITAAHCVFDKPTGSFFADFAFVPDQYGPVNVSDPNVVWGYTDVLVNSRYVQTTNPLSPSQPFWPFDYAMIKLAPKTINGRQTSIATLTGAFPLGTNSRGGTKYAVGYSSEGPDFDPYCPRATSNECYPFFTLSPVTSYATYSKAETGLDTNYYEIGFGAFLPNQNPKGPSGGMSGGPVLERIDNEWRVTSVVSNGPSVLDGAGNRLYARNLWGPYLDKSASDMLGVI